VDSGNGFGTMVFWTAVVPDNDVQVNLATGTAELHVHDLPELDYYSPAGTGDLASLGPTWQSSYFASTVSFDVAWSGPVSRQVNVKDTANGFAGQFSENQATVTWSVQSDSGFRFTSNAGNFSTSVPETPGVNGMTAPLNFFAQVGQEQNGVFFPSGAALQADPVNHSLTDLVVNGSSTGGVQIQVQSILGGQELRVLINGADQAYQADFPTTAVARLLIRGGPGDDHIAVANNVVLPAILMGSYGNDHIQAGGGPTVLVGAAGQDQLDGGPANDILIGGADSDHLQGHSGSDVLIAGTTNFDNNVPALVALISEWGRTDESYAQRVANLSNSTINGVSPGGGQNGGCFLNATTVQDDGAGNLLEGGPALDWFFANLDGTGNGGVKDRITGLLPGEIVTRIVLPGP
jgi:hypothetical protein